MAQQHLDLAYQADEGSPSRSSSPEVNTAAQTAAEQNRLNFAQEKQGESTEKGSDVIIWVVRFNRFCRVDFFFLTQVYLDSIQLYKLFLNNLQT